MFAMEAESPRDIKCRQNSIFALGNLCTNKQNFELMCELGCLKFFMTFSFPNTTEKSANYDSCNPWHNNSP